MATSEFRSYKAESAVIGYRIIKFGATDLSAAQSTGPTDLNIGTSDSLDKATGEMVDCQVGDVGEVRLGAAVTRGQALTADANGKAVSTTTVGHRCIGYAEMSGNADDVITYIRSPFVL